MRRVHDGARRQLDSITGCSRRAIWRSSAATTRREPQCRLLSAMTEIKKTRLPRSHRAAGIATANRCAMMTRPRLSLPHPHQSPPGSGECESQTGSLRRRRPAAPALSPTGSTDFRPAPDAPTAAAKHKTTLTMASLPAAARRLLAAPDPRPSRFTYRKVGGGFFWGDVPG